MRGCHVTFIRVTFIYFIELFYFCDYNLEIGTCYETIINTGFVQLFAGFVFMSEHFIKFIINATAHFFILYLLFLYMYRLSKEEKGDERTKFRYFIYIFALHIYISIFSSKPALIYRLDDMQINLLSR